MKIAQPIYQPCKRILGLPVKVGDNIQLRAISIKEIVCFVQDSGDNLETGIFWGKNGLDIRESTDTINTMRRRYKFNERTLMVNAILDFSKERRMTFLLCLFFLSLSLRLCAVFLTLSFQSLEQKLI